ncbi:armadillo-type protein [Boletus edulis]|nr:armadillo-type protein [Boletus edulis]
MPREIRKRGKKHKKAKLPEGQTQEREDPPPNGSGEPSWIVSVREAEDIHPEAPFGYVDPDVKAYFRTVDEQIQSWQEARIQPMNEDGDLDPNEEKQVFFVAALSEMSGKEKQLATDPDCSVILERMAYSMNDFVLRVLMDRLNGSFEVLFKHRFASHVCQTLLSVAADTISREVKNIYPDVSPSKDNGELRTLTQLVLDLCEEVGPGFNSLITDPFASHVLRSLLLLLCPTALPEDSARNSVRSKKSMSWKTKQGQMKSVFSDDKGKGMYSSTASVPGSFREASDQFLRILRDGLDANEVRALAASKVASPVLSLVLEIEADHGSASTSDSLMDRVLVGMITTYLEEPTASIEPSDYVVTLLRDPTSSHLLETLVSRCPEEVFRMLWSTYFDGKLARLALHPVANFVVAKAVERQDSEQLGNTLEELKSSWSKLISKFKSSRTGVLRTLIDRSRTLGTHQKDVCEAVLTGVGISSSESSDNLVSCLLSMKSLEEYQATPTSEAMPVKDHKKHDRKGQADDQREPKIQGALILQSLLRLDEPHCSIVIDSISSFSVEEVLRIAQNATSSRVLDVLFESPSVSFKAKRRFVMSLIGHYHSLADDRIGSRIADRCWAFADPYLREKIARSLIPFEQFLVASFYGKFFARSLNLYLLQRRPDEWRTLQSHNKTSAATSTQQSLSSPSSKRRDTSEDEIDTVFKAVLGNKAQKAAVGRVSVHRAQRSTDKHMSEVLGAIRVAPSGESSRAKRRKVK